MIQTTLHQGYCIDTSSLIDLKTQYPQDVFPSLWENLEDIISNGYLVSPQEVYKEIEKQDDELLKWAKKHKKMFKDLDFEQLRQVRDILKHFPNLVDVNKTTPDADPFIIALALSKGWIVITSEKPANPGARPKIPDVCKYYSVRCISLVEFFREQGWKF